MDHSGDTDSVVPVTATRFSIGHLNLTVKIPWYPWYAGRQVLVKTGKIYIRNRLKFLNDLCWFWCMLMFMNRLEDGLKCMKEWHLHQWEEQGMKFHWFSQEEHSCCSNPSWLINHCPNLEEMDWDLEFQSVKFGLDFIFWDIHWNSRIPIKFMGHAT